MFYFSKLTDYVMEGNSTQTISWVEKALEYIHYHHMRIVFHFFPTVIICLFANLFPND